MPYCKFLDNDEIIDKTLSIEHDNYLNILTNLNKQLNTLLNEIANTKNKIERPVPVINDITWNNDDHIGTSTYTLTIDAADPNGLPLSYQVVTNDPDILVTIGSNDNIFYIEYPDYAEIVDVVFKITVTNSDELSTTKTIHHLVYPISTPVIDEIIWDNRSHHINSSYTVTIVASDQNGYTLSYSLESDRDDINIVQDTITPNVFQVTYPSYDKEVSVKYTITVTNEKDKKIRIFDFILVHYSKGPIIVSTVWDDPEHFEGSSYILTIDAFDPDGLDLTYELECDNTEVTLEQNVSDPSIFQVTYAEPMSNLLSHYTVKVTNTNNISAIRRLFAVLVKSKRPVIDSITWNDSNQYEQHTYVLTITAHDPNELDLSYQVSCNDTNVTINQDPNNPNIFQVSYGSYVDTSVVEYTITVTNTSGRSNTETSQMTVNAFLPPVIDSVTWNDSNQYEQHSYVLTITAHDPQDFHLSYVVTCNDGSVNIVNDPSHDNVFHVTYPNYISDTEVIFDIIVINEDNLTANISQNITVNAYAPPIVTSITWDNTDHWEQHSYVMNIVASDSQGFPLTFEVECSITGTTVNQDTTNPNVFHVTYPNLISEMIATYTITITNSEGLSTVETSDIVVHAYQPPVIDNISWNKDYHVEQENYTLTITAHDPNGFSLTYDVISNDTNVTIVQDTNDPTIFHVTYPDYSTDTNVTFTITVTNSDNSSTSTTDTKTCHIRVAPIIDGISWSPPEPLYEQTFYTMTVNSHDPQDSTITYDVTTNASGVGITHSSPTSPDFNISFPSYNIDTTITFTITVSNEYGLSASGTYDVVAHSFAAPVINSVDWNPTDDHQSSASYDLIVNAIDINSPALPLSYQVVADDSNVSITPDGIDSNIFHITYPEYYLDTDITYTITVTNSDGLSTTATEVKTVYAVSTLNARGVFAGGGANHPDAAHESSVDYITINTPGDAVYGFSLTAESMKSYFAAASNGSNGTMCLAGGYNYAEAGVSSIITLSITNLTQSIESWNLSTTSCNQAASSNGPNDRMVIIGGILNKNSTGNSDNNMYYLTISNPANVTWFGTGSSRSSGASTSNGVNDRAISIGGMYYIGSASCLSYNYLSAVEYITISTPGDAAYFGDLGINSKDAVALSNTINERAVFIGGYSCQGFQGDEVAYSDMTYFTINSPSDGTAFGNMISPRAQHGGTSNGRYERGVFGYGIAFGETDPYISTMEYITINTTGNALSFGSCVFLQVDGIRATSNAN